MLLVVDGVGVFFKGELITGVISNGVELDWEISRCFFQGFIWRGNFAHLWSEDWLG